MFLKHTNKEHRDNRDKRNYKGILDSTFVNDMELIEKSQEHDSWL